MLFCNRLIDVDRPSIMDIAPTVLDLFGVPVPAHMDGKPIMRGTRAAPTRGPLRESQSPEAPQLAVQPTPGS